MSLTRLACGAILLMAGLMVLPSGSAQTYTVLYTFKGRADGALPFGSLIQDSVGNLYGTTAGTQAGTTAGSVFKLTPGGKFKLLHNFGAGGAGGAEPFASLVQDSAGNLYGTTSEGGSSGQGLVFKLDNKANFSVLHTFSGDKDGAAPVAPLLLDPAGKLYGTTYGGGTPNCNLDLGTDCGAVFEVDSVTGEEKVIQRFAKSRIDGDAPYSGLFRDAGGNLFGSASVGGPRDSGTIFKLDSTHHETIVYAFSNSSGGEPVSKLIQDAAGNFYGTTVFGGGVYRLDPQGNETVLHTFRGPDGRQPEGDLIMDSAGNLYGTAYLGGNLAFNCNFGLGCGVVFKMDPAGNETVLYSFNGGTDGYGPYAGLVMDSAGNLYGTTAYGGHTSKICPSGCGVVFKITP